MFIEALVISIVIGYLLKGSIKNLNIEMMSGVYLVIAAFLIEAVMVFLISRGMIVRGTITYFFNLIMYIMIFIFAYLNRNNRWILVMSIGFLLNAVPIFLNGGAMPVSTDAAIKAGLTTNVSSEGLYLLIKSGTKAALLGDIIPVNFIGHFVVSIGDMIAAIGMSIFIITGMKNR